MAESTQGPRSPRIGDISHEVGNCLAGISSVAFLLESRHAGPLTADQAELISRIDVYVDRMKPLLAALMGLAKRQGSE